MKNFTQSLCLLALSIGVGACQSPPNVINSYSRPLTENELDSAIADQNAELIVSQPDNQHNWVVLDAGNEIRYGSYSATVFEFEDQTSDSSINHSIYSTAENPNTPVSITQGKSEQFKKSVNEQSSLAHGFLIVVVRDQKIRRELDSAQITFNDQSQTTISTHTRPGFWFQYDVQKDCCKKIDLISKSNQTLFSKELP